jgi:hypothetical protein
VNLRPLACSPSRPRATWLRRATSLAVITALSTCASLTHIDVQSDGKATIPGATLIDKLLGPLDFAGFDSIDFSEELENQGATKDQVNSVHLQTFTLSVDTPAAGNFDFLSSVTFFAESDGLPRVKIASISAIPKGAQKLELVVDEAVDLEPYVVAPSMKISGSAEGSKPDQDTGVSAHVVLDVDVHIPGCN